jgi:tRNA U55 pseudouridine synthase TruB
MQMGIGETGKAEVKFGFLMEEIRCSLVDIVNPENIPELYFTCECSKGTYIRSLANDFGKALQSGAYLSSLRRDGIGDFHVNQALHIDEVIAFIEASTLNVDIQSDKG